MLPNKTLLSEISREPHDLAHPQLAKIKKSVLVVDDDDFLLNFSKTILEMEDYEVFTAQSGGEGLQLLAQIKAPDLILLDMRMEDMSGTDFLVTLERTHPEILKNVPVVFLSGVDVVPESKASGFIKKPFDIDYFLNDIKRFIDARVRDVPLLTGDPL